MATFLMPCLKLNILKQNFQVPTVIRMLSVEELSTYPVTQSSVIIRVEALVTVNITEVIF